MVASRIARVRVIFATATAVLALAFCASPAWAASVTISGPVDGATFVSPASITFSGTRDSSGCNIPPTAETFGLYLEFLGSSTFNIFAMNISGETTISATLPITQPGTYHWKGALTCNTNGMGGATSVESETRSFIIQAAPPPDVTPPALTGSVKQAKLKSTGIAFAITSTEAATGTAGGSISIPGAHHSARFKTGTVQLAAGKPTTVTLTLSRKDASAVRKALKHHKLKAKVNLALKDAAGNQTVKKLTLALKR